MTSSFYLLGIVMAILAGIVNNFGIVLQKKIVNKIRDNSKFTRNLIKNPLWLLGLGLQTFVGGLFLFIAQIFLLILPLVNQV